MMKTFKTLQNTPDTARAQAIYTPCDTIASIKTN